jgi:hypothetical protein
MRQVLAEAIHPILANSLEDPPAYWAVGKNLTLASKDHPLGQALLQQDHWTVDLQPGELAYERWRNTIVIYNRQILEDPDALFLAKALAEGKRYLTLFKNLPGRMPPQGILSLLYLYHRSTLKSILRVGCKNRLVMLLEAGRDLRKTAHLPNQEMGGYMAMSITEYTLY